MTETVSARVRRRIKEEMQRKRLNQTDVAEMLKWTQSRVSKVLTGRTQLGVDELTELCFVLDLSLVEMVRDQGLEFVAEMTPTELRMLQNFRKSPKDWQASILTILSVSPSPTAERFATPPKFTSLGTTIRKPKLK